MPADDHDHPWFTRIYSTVAAVGEHAAFSATRDEILGPAYGRLLIVGLGPGHDLDHLPTAVTSVVAVEPSASMRRRARPRIEAAESRGVDVEVLDGVAEQLPLPDASVDSVLLAFVLCSVSEPRTALAEVRRVLRSDGVVCVLEHVAAPPRTWTHRLQRAARPVWPHIAGGCDPMRDTRSDFVAAGFDTSALRDRRLLNVPVVAATLLGTTRPTRRQLRPNPQ